MAEPTDAPKRVAVLTDVAALSKPFDYDVPPSFSGPIEPGSRVRVPLHGRSVRGWVVSPGQETLDDAKPLKSTLGIGPTPEIVELAKWASWRWAGPWARFLGSASSKTIVRALPHAPEATAPSIPESPLGALGASLALFMEPQSIRLGPATDPFDLVLGFLGTVLNQGSAVRSSVVVLVPGRGYAQRLVARLSRRGLAAIDVGDDWAAARAGWPVVVGTRVGAMAPVPVLAGMIVLDAEDDRYYSESAPTWNVADLSRRRCDGCAPLVLVSSCPNAIVQNGTKIVSPDGVKERDGWPIVEIVDQREEDPRSGILSSRFVELGRSALAEQQEGVAIACVLNRKGRARLVVCGRCDNVARCTSCDAACLLDATLDCPRCGAQRPVICSSCGATAMKLLRLGTSQLAVDCEALFGVKTVEMTAASPADVLNGARIVVGTEAVLHRVRSTRLAVFLDLDHHLLAPRAGAEIRALAMVGRAGRLVGGRGSNEPGTVLVQTRLSDHPVIRAAVQGDPSAVIESDGAIRRLLDLSPFGAVARMRGPGAEEYAAVLLDAGLEISTLGDGDVLVKAQTPATLANAFAENPRPREAVRVSVDPESI